MRFLLSLFVIMMLGFPVVAQATERFAQLRIYADRADIEAGDVLTVAIQQNIAGGWHTYWKNPGDSGAEPRFTWRVPEGFDVGATQWPAPQKIPYGPLMNFGYSNMATTLHAIKVPADYDGEPVNIEVDVDILVCEDVCIPEFETLTLDLLSGQGVDADKVADARRFIPEFLDTEAVYWEAGGEFHLKFRITADDDPVVGAAPYAYFFPYEWGLIDNMAEAEAAFVGGGTHIEISQACGDRELSEIDEDRFVVFDGGKFYEIEAKPASVKAALSLAENGSVAPSLLLVLLGAFTGGLVLNLMPCVFPVLSIKALSLVKIADGHPEEARAHGIAYTAGVVLSFLAVVGALMALKFGGAQIGWGFQLQSPIVVAVLIYLLFVVALNLFGVFEVKSLGHVGGKAADEGGLKGAFFTGVLATIVATPCTAPFMATAIGVALTQSVFIGLLIFAVIGLGLAFPYLALSFIPALQRFLPKPGAWMKTFQQLLAFPMMVAVVWLLWVLSQQVESMQLFAVILGLVAMAFGVWAWQHRGVIAKVSAVIGFICVIWSLFIILPHAEPANFGSAFSDSALEEALASDDPVFVEMTAAWCITCKVNHAAAINVDATKALFAEKDVVYLIGDWTNKDDVITRYLEQFGRNGVPIYVFYGAPDEGGVRPDPVLLPQLLTPGIVEKYVLGTN